MIMFDDELHIRQYNEVRKTCLLREYTGKCTLDKPKNEFGGSEKFECLPDKHTNCPLYMFLMGM